MTINAREMLKHKTERELIDLGMQLYLEDIKLKQEILEYKRKNKLWFFKSYYHWLKNERVFHQIAFLKVDMELLERFGRDVLGVEAKSVTNELQNAKKSKLNKNSTRSNK